ncbi:MAG: DUF4286 family protein [Chitinophagaceae bacterium]
MDTLFISNETFKLDWSIHEEWLEWVDGILLPEVRNSAHTQWVRFVKLHGLEEDDGPTYALQTGFAAKADYNRFVEIEVPPLMQQAYSRWQEQFFSFRTLMEVLHDGQ